MKKTEKEKILNQYKTDFGIEKSETGHKKVWKLFKASARESWEYLVKFFTFYISILGILLSIWSGKEYGYKLLVSTLILIIVTEIVLIILSYVKFSRNVLVKKINNMSFEIKLEDYIVNMIDLLLENKKNTKLIFAMGMNQSVLRMAMKNQNKTEENNFTSITHDFMKFMLQKCDINIVKVAQKVVEEDKRLLKIGSVFMVDYQIENAQNEYQALNGCEFTVAYYVNSVYKDKKGKTKDECVEDGRETVIHLIDKLSDYIYENRKGSNKKFIVMLPAIGAGKTGKAPYRNVLLEIINHLSIRGYCVPDKLVLSLRNYELFNSEFEASSLLRIAKKIISKS